MLNNGNVFVLLRLEFWPRLNLICRGEWNLACNFDADALVQVSFLSRDEVKKKMFT